MAPVRKRRMVWQRVTTQASTAPSPCADCGFGKATKSSNDQKARAAALVPAKNLNRTPSDENLEEPSDSTSTVCPEGGHLSGNEASMDSSSEYSSPRISTDKYSADFLLRARRFVIKTEMSGSQGAPRGSTGRLTTQRRPLTVDGPSAMSWRPKALQLSAEPGAPAPQLPTASPNSWAQAQRERRKTQELGAAGLAEAETPSAESVARRVKSILNKLTPEKFATLYTKLMECGIRDVAHMDMLARVIFDEAVVQHKFTGMYADLCMCLFGDLPQEASAAFGDNVLGHCLALLGTSIDQQPNPASPKGAESPEDAEAAEEARALQKKRGIGNVRFIGELLIRNLLEAQVLFTCTEQFIAAPCEPHKLEMLASLLTVVGPVLDNALWPHHCDLLPVFWHVRGLTFDSTVPKRVRCLLRDVVELRDAGWVDESKCKQNQKPMMLDEVRNGPSQEMHEAASAEWMAMADFGDGAFSSWNADNPMDYSDYTMVYGEEGMLPMEKSDSQCTTTCSFSPSSSELTPQGKQACASDLSEEGS